MWRVVREGHTNDFFHVNVIYLLQLSKFERCWAREAQGQQAISQAMYRMSRRLTKVRRF